MSRLQEFLDMVPSELLDVSGEVFHSGRSAFESPAAPIYLLGLNPGGDPEALNEYSIAAGLEEARTRDHDDWSVYCDEAWGNFEPGAHPYQKRILHMLGRCGLPPRMVPASNVIFARTVNAAAIGDAARWDKLSHACWKVHAKVISALGIRVVICFGKDAGQLVRKQLGASVEVERWAEEYERRRWVNTTHRQGQDGIQVVTLSHPSWADWTNPKADPSPLVLRALAR
jgi:hypothetical protein